MTLTQKHILIIEDERDTRESLTQALGTQGYRVDAVVDGLAALEKFEDANFLPDLILLDFMMPKMDGYEFRTWQLQAARVSKIPIVVLSAGVARPKPDAGIFQNAVIIKKPVDLALLLEKIASILSPTGLS